MFLQNYSTATFSPSTLLESKATLINSMYVLNPLIVSLSLKFLCMNESSWCR